MATFKLSAEFSTDVGQLLTRISVKRVELEVDSPDAWAVVTIEDPKGPKDGEKVWQPLDLAGLLAAIVTIPDGRVMYETVQHAKDYNGDRIMSRSHMLDCASGYVDQGRDDDDMCSIGDKSELKALAQCRGNRP